MKKLIYILGLVLLALATSGYAVTFYNVNVSSEDNTTAIFFDQSLTVDSLDIGNSSLKLTNMDLGDCGLKTFNFTSGEYLSSSFYTAFGCVQQVFDERVDSIFALSIALGVLLLFIVPFMPGEMLKYIVMIFVAVILLIGVQIVT